MKIACICCTYKRPVQLANVIACFVSQDHTDRELIILDDAGQYQNQSGDRWRLVSVDQRFRTLGEKRNASAALVSSDVDAYAVWDDDDAYLPWHLSAAAAALQSADYTIPTKLWIEKPGPRLEVQENQYMYHGGWTFRRLAFERAGGYPFEQSGQDQSFLRRLKQAKLRRADPLQFDSRPSYVYRWCTIKGHKHLSALDKATGYLQMADLDSKPVAGAIVPQLERDWTQLATPPGRPQSRPITAVMLNWKRPDNVREIVSRWRDSRFVDEVLIWDNSGELEPLDGATVVRCSQNMTFNPRFAMAALARNDCILMQDDDLVTRDEHLARLYSSWQSDPDVIHGVFGRHPRVDGSYAENVNCQEAEVAVVLTRLMMFHRRYAAEFFRALPAFAEIQDGYEPRGNGEDLVLNYAVRKITGRLNRVHNIKPKELPAPHAVCGVNGHYQQRTKLMRRGEEWLATK